MDVSLFDYDLPEALIAQKPLERRDASRLMVLDRARQSIAHRRFDELPNILRPGDVLVMNDSKVIPARLFGEKADTGAHIEVLLLHPLAENADTWEALVRPARRVGLGTTLIFGAGRGNAASGDERRAPLVARVVGVGEEGVRQLSFRYRGRFEDVLSALGEMPLPPYIREKLDDPSRYQTVYARERGSVAAPTAGLHFTPELLSALRARGIDSVMLTLHVGLGTFRPVQVEAVEEHRMHSEFFRLTPEAASAIARAKAAGRRIVAVGTTALRALESATSEDGVITAKEGWTDLFIYPGYRFRAVDALITNFHLPRSTLLMLVAAFAGRTFVLDAYREAVRKRYRFYSFGDAMLVV
ncbi:MAG: tRNA preQ1(34) S-adenosylmethionine ribosyltransferase-isomerase QueA [Hydrogenibacillus sp.]|nr:tRNA preQ1(34) S-adenosylmethionine ribosyltransferase-isomerase QueA [Hydrogenibacillus sp.]